MGNNKLVEISCIDCKSPFLAHNRNARRHSGHRRARKAETSLKWRISHGISKAVYKPKLKPVKLSISEVLKLQEEYNSTHSPKLSYGNFIAYLERGGNDDKLRQISKQKNKP